MKQKINSLITELNSGLIEREPHIKEALLTMLAGENLLLVGPPGTAKSEIARRLSSVIQDGNYFEYLLTKFTTPEELFGQFSMEGMKNDKLERKIDSYLPTSNIAFLDETFKANSSILNSLLTVMNEKIFHNGSKKEETKLLSVIGATNELPKEGTDLQALYDRFLTRMFIDYVSEDKQVELLLSENKKFDGVSLKSRFKIEELQKFHKDIEKVKLSPESAQIVVEIHKELKEKFNENEFETISDRRLKKALQILKASALSNERDEVNVLDISLLSNIFWNDDENRETVEKTVLSKLPTADSQKASKMNFLYDKQFKKFEELGISGNVARERNEQGQPLFLDRDGEKTTDSEREYDDSEVKNMHLQEANGEYIYFYHQKGFQYSAKKQDTYPNDSSYKLVYTTDFQGQVVPAQKENGEYIYLYTYQKTTNQKSERYDPYNGSRYRQVTHQVKISNLTKLQHQPSNKDLRFFGDDLEIFSQQAADKLPTMQKTFDEIKANRDDIANSLETHLWIDSEKLTFIKESAEKDLVEAKGVLEKFTELSNSVKLYSDKAKQQEKEYKASLPKFDLKSFNKVSKKESEQFKAFYEKLNSEYGNLDVSKHEEENSVKDILTDLKNLKETLSSYLPKVQSYKDKIQNKCDKFDSHMSKEFSKEEIIEAKKPLEINLKEANIINSEFQELYKIVELYYKKAIEDRENYKKSLQNG